MSNHRKIRSKAKAHTLVRRKVRRMLKNNVNEASASRDSMKSARRLYGGGMINE